MRLVKLPGDYNQTFYINIEQIDYFYHDEDAARTYVHFKGNTLQLNLHPDKFAEIYYREKAINRHLDDLISTLSATEFALKEESDNPQQGVNKHTEILRLITDLNGKIEAPLAIENFAPPQPEPRNITRLRQQVTEYDSSILATPNARNYAQLYRMVTGRNRDYIEEVPVAIAGPAAAPALPLADRPDVDNEDITLSAMSLWEAVYHARTDGSTELKNYLESWFDNYGTGDIRQRFAEKRFWLHEVYEGLPEEIRGNFSFDWEICPSIVKNLGWDNEDQDPDLLFPSAEVMIARVRADFGR
jgi:hypothetical protein